jgi:hypothetical protein
LQFYAYKSLQIRKLLCKKQSECTVKTIKFVLKNLKSDFETLNY